MSKAATTPTADSELLAFVETHYAALNAEAEKDNTDPSKQVEIKNVITSIEKLFETFKNSDSKHDTIVGQLKGLQAAYITLKLDEDDYPRYATASANLKTIMAGLKEEGAGAAGSKEAKKGVGREEEEDA
jgi:hypothetical protein